jgi:PPM family protein phosphatase
VIEETTAEFPVETLATVPRLRLRPVVSVGLKTDLGRVRENNEDKAEFNLAEDDVRAATKGHVFVVCDGMGGHEAGQIASELACKTFLDVYLNHPSDDASKAMRDAVAAANRFVLDVSRAVPSRRGMGTTLTAAVLREGEAMVAHVGDSRLYRLRDGECEMITRDHTWIEEMVASGAVSLAEAETHPRRHMLLRAIGTEADWMPDIFGFPALEGDLYMLCSDGVTNHVSDEQVAEVMATSGPSGVAWRLVSMALGGGGSDNATCLAFRVDALQPVDED